MKTKHHSPLWLALLLPIALVLASDSATEGARAALHTCTTLIIPCLFPFFAVSLLVSGLGLPKWLGSKLQAPMSLLFGVSGTGAGIFLLSILGGYPIGAALIADSLKRGDLTRKEAETMLCFCNNSGPAFLVGAVGVGVFHSSAVGLLLYGVHILAAIITGMFLSGSGSAPSKTASVFIETTDLSTLLPDAIGKAVTQTLLVCGYVVFFGAVSGILESTGLLSSLCGTLALATPLTLHHARALCMGLLELGCGIGALAGTTLSPQSLTLCAVLTGFGGVSVALQTGGVLHGTDLPLCRHLLGRLCCSGISGFLMYSIASILL